MDLECKKIEEDLKKLLFEPKRLEEQQEQKHQSAEHSVSKYKNKKASNQKYPEEWGFRGSESDKRHSGHKRKPKYSKESWQSYNSSLPDGHYQNVNDRQEEHSSSSELKKPVRYQRHGHNVSYNQKSSRRDLYSLQNQEESSNSKFSDVQKNTDKEFSFSQNKYDSNLKQKSAYRKKKVKNKIIVNGLITPSEKRIDHSSDHLVKQSSNKNVVTKVSTYMDEKEFNNSFDLADPEILKDEKSANKNNSSKDYDNSSSHLPMDDDNKEALDKREKKKRREKKQKQKKEKNKGNDPLSEFSASNYKTILKPSSQQTGSPQEMNDQEQNKRKHISDDRDILHRFGNKEWEDLLKLEQDGFQISCNEKKIHFECKVCLYTCFELPVALRHSKNRDHQIKKQDYDFEAMLRAIPEPLSCQTESVTELLIKIVEQNGLSTSEMAGRKLLVKFLNENFQKFLPGCEFELVGSSVTGFGLKTSEADIALITPSDGDAADLLALTYDLIKNVQDFTDVHSEFTEKVPQIHFTVESTNLKCNITLNNSFSSLTSKLLGDYASIDFRVRLLGIAFRYWAKICDVDQRKMGTLAPFCYPFLLIHYLQQLNPPVLPVLHELQSGKSNDTDSYLDPKDLEGKWKCENNESLGSLWIGLFKFYTVLFKFGEDVVTVCHLKPVTIKDKKWGTKFLAIEDFPNSKRNLANSIPNRQLFSYLTTCFKATYSYFAQPELSSGPLTFIKITVLEEEHLNIFGPAEPHPATLESCCADNENMTDLYKLSEISDNSTLQNITQSSQEKKHHSKMSSSPADREKMSTDLAEKSEDLNECLAETLEDQDPDISINEVIAT